MNEENNKKNLRYLFKRKGKSKRGYSKKYSLLKERELKEILIKTDTTSLVSALLKKNPKIY